MARLLAPDPPSSDAPASTRTAPPDSYSPLGTANHPGGYATPFHHHFKYLDFHIPELMRTQILKLLYT